MANATLRALVTEYGLPNYTPIMSHLEVDSGFLKTAQAIPANGNWYHKHKKVNALPSFAFTNVGGSITDTTVNNDLFQTDLKYLKSIQSEADDICENWPSGVKGYFTENAPAFAEAFGQAVSKSVFYGLNATFGDVSGFMGLHEIAKANSKRIQNGGTTGSRVSIIAVKFNPMNCGLLFNPLSAQAGKLLEIKMLNQAEAAAEVTSTTTGAKKIVYQCLYKGQLAFLSTGAYDVAAYTQIDASNLPTAPEMDQLVDLVHGDSDGRTILYLNRTARQYLRTLKTTALQMGVMDTNYSTEVDRWNGVPVVVDDNLSLAETTAID